MLIVIWLKKALFSFLLDQPRLNQEVSSASATGFTGIRSVVGNQSSNGSENSRPAMNPIETAIRDLNDQTFSRGRSATQLSALLVNLNSF